MVRAQNGADAERYLTAALEISGPGPGLLIELARAEQLQNREARAAALIEEIRQRWPELRLPPSLLKGLR